MRKYGLKLNESGDAFVCESDEQMQEAIARFNRGKMRSYLVQETPVSDEFRGYYFDGVIRFVHELKMYPEIANVPLNYRNEGVSLVDVYHELLKRDFNGITVATGEKIGKSIAVKDSEDFDNYIKRISEYTSENFLVPVPSPDDFKMSGLHKKEFTSHWLNLYGNPQLKKR